MGLRSLIRRHIARRNYPIPVYRPVNKRKPEKTIDVFSEWRGLELIIEDILDRFDIGRESCIEFGPERGYSTVVLSNYFKKVRGVDIFTGDIHSGHKECHYEETKRRLSEFGNIELIKADYRDWIKQDDDTYDFAHVDIIHTYEDTYRCGLWAVNHSKCCVFHDTESFPAVRKAVFDIAATTGKRVYNYPRHHGLGIIVG